MKNVGKICDKSNCCCLTSTRVACQIVTRILMGKIVYSVRHITNRNHIIAGASYKRISRWIFA